MRSRPAARPAWYSALGNNKRCFASMRELKRARRRTASSARCSISRRISPTSIRPASSGGWRDDPSESPGRRHDRRRPASDRRAGESWPARSRRSTPSCSRKSRHPIRAMSLRCWCSSQAARPGRSRPCGPRRCIWRVHVFGTKGWAEARDETTLTVGARRGRRRRAGLARQIDFARASCWRPLPRASRPASPFRSPPPRCSMSSALLKRRSQSIRTPSAHRWRSGAVAITAARCRPARAPCSSARIRRP